jgi:hypothetical protein
MWAGGGEERCSDRKGESGDPPRPCNKKKYILSMRSLEYYNISTGNFIHFGSLSVSFYVNRPLDKDDE